MKKRVAIVTHSFSPGTSQALCDYCLRKKYDALFIEHSLFGNIFNWIFGAFDTLWKVLKQGKRYDLYVGSNRLNAIVGILLKKMGVVKKAVYFSPDWSKNRFNNKFLNFIFQKLDYLCIKYADIVWNSSHVIKLDPMMEERLKLSYPRSWLKKQIQVPDGTDYFPIPSFNKINRYEIGFVGHLKKEMGVQLVIDTLPSILKKLPKVRLLIIGSGPLGNELRKKARGLPVEFTGFIGNIQEVYKRLSRCAIAIAPYEESKQNISQYSDPGKTKNYFSVGLPIIITKVPKIAYEIDQKKCGIAIYYDKKEFTNAVLRLLKKDDILKMYRKNVLKLRRKYNWNSIFDRALRLTEKV
ncbi:glycosyltransferase family 4 protein [Candidatus Roizmanbacteria bacterium]|nr:glycosyltransferase family 4 protein [Candidatus Roizmanbacteria bacterium]